MTSINTTTWREFCVGDLFDIRPTKNYRLNNSELFASEGNTRVVVNSSQNNGIGGYVGLEPTEPGNVVTFSDTTDANGIFIQDEPFVGYSHVQGMHCKDGSVSFEALQFFATVFKAKAMTMGFNYQNKFRRDAASKIIVKLPATPDGKPDWDYMEQYMKSVMENTKARLQRNQKIANAAKHGIDISNWKEFRIEDLFELERGKESAPKRNPDGDVWLVSETRENNGYTRKVKPKAIIQGNCITVSVNYAETVFYQPSDFCASVNILILRNDFIDEFSGQFIASVLSVNNRKYTYENKISAELLMKTCLKLPATPDGKPDWDYMESYMKSVMENAKTRLQRNQKIANATKHSIDISNWKEFRVGDLFKVETTKSIDKRGLNFDDSYEYAYIMRTSNNEGVAGYIESLDYEPNAAGTLSVVQIGENCCIYRDTPWYATQNIFKLTPLNTSNEDALRFASCVISKQLKHDFSEAAYSSYPTKTTLAGMNIKLPATPDGKPDWDYMKAYMRERIESRKRVLNETKTGA